MVLDTPPGNTGDSASATEPLFLTGTDGDDRMSGTDGADVIMAAGGNDVIIDTVGDNYLYGNEGDDELIGCGTLSGGPGNDLIRGNGVFRFDLGDGHDTIGSRGRVEHISDHGSYYQYHGLNDSTLRFGQGIVPLWIRLERRNGNLQFELNDHDTVTIEKWFEDSNARLGAVEFASGERWTRASIDRLPMMITGTPGNDTLEGTTGNNLIDGQGGNDFISAAEGDNLIFGGAGNDVIMGRGAIHGGAGDDTIIARGDSAGNIYYYERGQGHDMLYLDSHPGSPSDRGTVTFLDPLQEDELWFRRQNDNLAISLVGSSDGVTINNWFLGAANQVSNFKLGNQKTMSSARVDSLVQAMARFDAPLADNSTLSVNMQQSLAAVLAASWIDTQAT